MTKFTEGPWKVEERFNSPDHDDKLCSIVSGDGNDWIIAEVCGDSANPENDARLIAAAPELYEALRNLTDACLEADGHEDLAPEIDGSLLDTARSILSRVEGSRDE